MNTWNNFSLQNFATVWTFQNMQHLIRAYPEADKWYLKMIQFHKIPILSCCDRNSARYNPWHVHIHGRWHFLAIPRRYAGYSLHGNRACVIGLTDKHAMPDPINIRHRVTIYHARKVRLIANQVARHEAVAVHSRTISIILSRDSITWTAREASPVASLRRIAHESQWNGVHGIRIDRNFIGIDRNFIDTRYFSDKYP